jgi:hypothetical protein
VNEIQPRCQIIITHTPDGQLSVQCSVRDPIYFHGLMKLAADLFDRTQREQNTGMGIAVPPAAMIPALTNSRPKG